MHFASEHAAVASRRLGRFFNVHALFEQTRSRLAEKRHGLCLQGLCVPLTFFPVRNYKLQSVTRVPFSPFAFEVFLSCDRHHTPNMPALSEACDYLPSGKEGEVRPSLISLSASNAKSRNVRLLNCRDQDHLKNGISSRR